MKHQKPATCPGSCSCWGQARRSLGKLEFRLFMSCLLLPSSVAHAEIFFGFPSHWSLLSPGGFSPLIEICPVRPVSWQIHVSPLSLSSRDY